MGVECSMYSPHLVSHREDAMLADPPPQGEGENRYLLFAPM